MLLRDRLVLNITERKKMGFYTKKSYAGESYEAYVPPKLPVDIDISGIRHLLDKANVALGKLDGASSILPDINLFIFMYVKKEAVLSSQIEGTQSSLSDLLKYEAGDTPIETIDDVVEVSNYVEALKYALDRIQVLPLSLRLIRETHKILLTHSRGQNKLPGEFRTSQNWIGGTRPGNAIYVPPPPEKLDECLGNFELFMHSKDLPSLIKIAICHAQFETIHPFLDGNGRMGRLLISLMLYCEHVIQKPVVYLSLYFKLHRQTYYDLLQRVRTQQDWISWIEFFLNGITHICENAIGVTNRVLTLFSKDKELLLTKGKSNSINLLMVYQAVTYSPIVSAQQIAKETQLSDKTVIRMLKKLQEMDIVQEITGNSRNKKFAYTKYLDIFLK